MLPGTKLGYDKLGMLLGIKSGHITSNLCLTEVTPPIFWADGTHPRHQCTESGDTKYKLQNVENKLSLLPNAHVKKIYTLCKISHHINPIVSKYQTNTSSLIHN